MTMLFLFMNARKKKRESLGSILFGQGGGNGEFHGLIQELLHRPRFRRYFRMSAAQFNPLLCHRVDCDVTADITNLPPINSGKGIVQQRHLHYIYMLAIAAGELPWEYFSPSAQTVVLVSKFLSSKAKRACILCVEVVIPLSVK